MSDSNKIDSIIRSMKRIAVVGLSSKADRPSYDVATYLQRAGFEIVPVNPAESGEILGRKVYPDLASVPGDIDVVDVFRRSDAVLPVAREVIARGGVSVFWMQLGISNADARDLLERHGVTVVEDHCLKVEHRSRH